MLVNEIIKITCDMSLQKIILIKIIFSYVATKIWLLTKQTKPNYKVSSQFIAPYAIIREKLELTLIQKVSDHQNIIY